MTARAVDYYRSAVLVGGPDDGTSLKILLQGQKLKWLLEHAMERIWKQLITLGHEEATAGA